MMRILVIGSGAREHAIVHALSRSSRNPELLVAPGNPGTASLAENVSVRVDDIESIVRLARDRAVDLVVVGPELPLVLGLADRLEAEGIPVMGPSAAAARLEGSKAFAKAFMARHGIPTAAYRTFQSDEYDEARAFIEQEGAPIVVKASGLAAGKGAVVCETLSEAMDALDGMMRGGTFGDASDFVVVESFMEGEEASLFAVCDGRDYVLLASAQDHKRIGEDDSGPNTGGMGAYGPAPIVTAEILEAARRRVIEPTLAGMAAEGHPYKGILYVGLMISGSDVRVVEFNCRLGDPEAQVILRLLKEDPVDLFERAANGTIAHWQLEPPVESCACVVLASEGYPGPYVKGKEIGGIPRAETLPGVAVYQAGTDLGPAGGLVTSGGRVLSVSAVGRDLGRALGAAYAGVAEIRFDGMQYRRDIGRKGLRHLGSKR